MSVSLALRARGYGKQVLFTTVWEIINTLQQSRADLSYHKKVQQYLKPDLLVLDEFDLTVAKIAIYIPFSTGTIQTTVLQLLKKNQNEKHTHSIFNYRLFAA